MPQRTVKQPLIQRVSVCLCVSGQLIKAVDDFEKSLLSALDQFIVVLHSDLHKASVSAETLLRVGRQQRSTVTAKVCLVCRQVYG